MNPKNSLDFQTFFLTSEFYSEKITTLANKKPLHHWILDEINKSVLYSFDVNWSSRFWLNYYFQKILPAFGNNHSTINDKLKEGYSWIKVLKNTYFTLIAYALQDPKSFKAFHLPLIERIASQIRMDLKNTFLLDHYSLPNNLLELEILKKAKKRKQKASNVKFFSLEALSFYEEGASIIEFINNTIEKNKDYKFQLVVPSIEYFDLVFEPLFLKNNLNYFVSKKKYFSNTLIAKLLFSLKRLYDDGFIYKDLLDTISLLGNYEFIINDESFQFIGLHPIFIKYNIGEERFENDLDLEESQLKKVNYFRKIILAHRKKIKKAKNLHNLFQQLFNLIQTLIGKNKVKLILNSGLENFLNELQSIDKLFDKNSKELVNLNLFLFELASRIPISEENVFTNQPIIVSTFNSLLQNVDVIIISGIDSDNYLFKQNVIDLSKPKKTQDVDSLFNYSKKSNLFLYEYFSNLINTFDFLPIKKLLITYNKYQSSNAISINNLFLDLWKKCTPIQKHEFHFLEKNQLILSQDIVIDKNKTISLYNYLWKSFSQSNLNVLFNDNYTFHIMNGIGINKYNEIRFNDGMLGSWIHEIISIYFSDSKKDNDQMKIKVFNDFSLKEAYKLKIWDMKKIISVIAKETSIYKKILRFRVLNDNQLDYWINYIAFKTMRFFLNLTILYKKWKIKVEFTEFKFGKNKDFETYVMDNYDKKPFEIRGSIDQVISYRNKLLKRKEYYLIDFKTSNRKALSLKTALLCEDNQQLLYMNSFIKRMKKNEIIRGFLYIPYYISKSSGTLADIERYSKDAFFRLGAIFNHFNNAPNNYVILNQNPTSRSLKNKDTFFLTYKALKKLLKWYEKEIVYKYQEIKSKGVLSIYPLKENRYNPLNTILPINWMIDIDTIALKKGTKNSIKYLISEINKWSKGAKKPRRKYIDSFVDGK